MREFVYTHDDIRTILADIQKKRLIVRMIVFGGVMAYFFYEAQHLRGSAWVVLLIPPTLLFFIFFIIGPGVFKARMRKRWRAW